MTKIALVSEMPAPEAVEALEAEGYMVCVGTIDIEPGRNVNADYYQFDESESTRIKLNKKASSIMLTGSFSTPILQALKSLEIAEEMRATRERMLRESNTIRYQKLEFSPKRHFEPKGKAPIPQKYKRNRFSR